MQIEKSLIQSYVELRTDFDALNKRSAEYERGLAVGRNAQWFCISYSGTW